MKKVIFLAGLFLVAFNSFAGVCGNGSLTGAYNINVSDVDSGQSDHFVGRINFNGKGAASIGGVSSNSGVAIGYTGSGTYSVTSACIATGTFSLSNGTKVTYWLYLDRMDTVPATNVAYHGNIVYKSTGEGGPGSGSGTIDRVFGKF
jgi:hypothetical protein